VEHHIMGAPRKIFLSNLMLLIGINLLIKPFYLLVIEAQVQERTGPDEFGIYFALLNISYILNILPDMGITNWNNRHISQQGHVNRNDILPLVRIRSILAAVYFIVCLVFAFTLHYNNHEITLLLILAFNQILAAGVLFMRSYLSGMHAFGADRIISVFDRLILIFFLGAALIFVPANEHFSIEYLILGQTLAYSITLILSFYFVWVRKTDELRRDSLTSKSIMSASIPFATLIVLSMMSGRIDAVMLERISGGFEAGIYAMTFRIGDMLNMISYLFAVMLLPIFSRMLSKNENVEPVFKTAFKLLLTGCLWLALVCAFYADWILNALYNSHITEASYVLPWTVGAAGLFSLQYTTGTLLTAGGKMKAMIAISALALALNISLNFFLIPSNAAEGAAQAAFFTQLFVFCIQIACTQKLFQVFRTSLIIRTVAFVFASTGLATIVSAFPCMPMFGICILSVGILTIGTLLQMIPIRDLILNLRPENAS
jgi:O-antigen/teichoic acid export membrane protein